MPVFTPSGSGPGNPVRVEFFRRHNSPLVHTPKRSPGSFFPMTGTPQVIVIDAGWERLVVEEPADPGRLFVVVSVTLP